LAFYSNNAVRLRLAIIHAHDWCVSSKIIRPVVHTHQLYIMPPKREPIQTLEQTTLKKSRVSVDLKASAVTNTDKTNAEAIDDDDDYMYEGPCECCGKYAVSEFFTTEQLVSIFNKCHADTDGIVIDKACQHCHKHYCRECLSTACPGCKQRPLYIFIREIIHHK